MEIGTRQDLEASPVFDEREIPQQLTRVSVIAEIIAGDIGTHVDGEGRNGSRSIRDNATGGGGSDIGERADALTETTEVERGGIDGTDVHHRPRREGIVATQSDRVLLVIEIIVIGSPSRAGETDVTRPHGDHLAGQCGHRPRDIEDAAIGGKETTRKGGILYKDGARQGRRARGSKQEDGTLPADARGILDVDSVSNRDAAFELELTGADEVDDVRAGAERPGDIDAEDTVLTAHVNGAGEIIPGVIQGQHPRTHLGEADVAGDSRVDRHVSGSIIAPLVEDEVRAIAGRDRTARDIERISPERRGDEDTATGHRQTGGRIKDERGRTVETQRINRQRRSPDGGQVAVIDVRTASVGRSIGSEGDDLPARRTRKTRPRIDGRPTRQQTRSISQIRQQDAASTHARGSRKVDA